MFSLGYPSAGSRLFNDHPAIIQRRKKLPTRMVGVYSPYLQLAAVPQSTYSLIYHNNTSEVYEPLYFP